MAESTSSRSRTGSGGRARSSGASASSSDGRAGATRSGNRSTGAKTTRSRSTSSSSSQGAARRRTGNGTAASRRTSSGTAASRRTSARRPAGKVEKMSTALGSAARKAAGPALAGGATVAAVAGGVLLKRQIAPKRRKVLGVPLPRPHLDGLTPARGLDLGPIARRMSSTGKQLTKLSDDLGRAGKAAQKMGDTLS